MRDHRCSTERRGPWRRAEGLIALALALASAPASSEAAAQSALGHSPNIRGPWVLAPGAGVFSFAHRFEFIEGGDVLQNYPTLSLGFGLPTQLAVGLDFSSNSEIVPTRINGNEFQLWIAADVLRGRRFGAHALAAWNSAARSADGAVTFRAQAGPLSLLLEARGFQDALGQGKAGAAGAVGAVWRLTPMLELSADAGRMLAPDSLETVWSAGLAIHIPGSPHTLGLHATNGGALTLQGASRPKVVGSERVRYGFVFTVPLGSWRQWGAIVRRSRAAATSGAAALVELRGLAFQPRQVRIRAGQSVEWINHDPVPHTVTATATTAAGPAWGSGVLLHGDRYVHTFPAPGRYRYTCLPHPQMTGVVIVEP